MEPKTPTAAPMTRASETTPHPGVLSTEVYVGAVGALPVRATLSVTPSRLDGRWVYEGRGSAEGLKLESLAGSRDGTYDVREMTASGETAGKLLLQRVGSALRGEWKAPKGDRSLQVVLTPEVRAREGENVVRARRIVVKVAGPPATAAPGFLPVIEGPAALRMMPNVTLKKLVGDDEGSLNDCCTTGVDFEVLHHDARVVTIATRVSTMGAYPSVTESTVSLAWATGDRIGAEAFRSDKKADLARLLNSRVHDSWRASKRELSKGPSDQAACGDVLRGEGPSFTEKNLDSVYVDAQGISFMFDFDFPHAVRACSPLVDLRLPWAAAQPYLDLSGSLIR